MERGKEVITVKYGKYKYMCDYGHGSDRDEDSLIRYFCGKCIQLTMNKKGK